METKSLFIFSTAFACSIFTMACNNNSKQENQQKEVISSKEIQATSQSENTSQDTIPISTTDLGAFPFFGLPENTEYLNKPLQRNYDEIYFPINNMGKLEKIAGQSFKSFISSTKNNEWSLPYLIKSYDEAIKAVGGVKLFEGKFKSEQVQFMNENAEHLGENGSIDFYNNTIHSYIIRRAEGDDVYIQFDGNSASGAIQIVQKEAFKQTISLIKAEQLEKDLNEKGKSILYIHFDTDKATLKPDGKTAVKEIASVLKKNENLKLFIHGYTDNVGDEAHNQTLSENRAKAIITELSVLGIDTSRLTAKGLGSQNPIADNTTSEGRAKNRRVELIKK